MSNQLGSFVNVGIVYKKDGNFVSNMSEELTSMVEEITISISQAIRHRVSISQQLAEKINDIEYSLSEASEAMI